MVRKIVIADDEPITRMDLREILEGAGYKVVGEALDGFDAVELCKRHLPDLVLIDIKMPLLDGINAAKIIQNQALAKSIIFLTAYSGEDFIKNAKECGALGYLVKPLNEKSLIPAIELAIARGEEILQFKNDYEKISRKLEERKIIEKAKGAMMERERISEQEAFNKMRSLSMNKRCSLREIAEVLLLSYE